jgi:hypothetical protein
MRYKYCCITEEHDPEPVPERNVRILPFTLS